MVANGNLDTPSATVELPFEVGDILFKERCIVMTNLTSPNNWIAFSTKKQHHFRQP